MQKPRRNKQRKGRKKPGTRNRSLMKRTAGREKAHLRRELRGNEFFPNSSKIGAGTRTAIRQSYKGKHRKNHRQNIYIMEKISGSVRVLPQIFSIM